MRTALALLSVLVAAGCSRPPSADSFVAAPLPSAFVALHSPNGQRQLLIERFGGRWQGHMDDTFASTSRIVTADAEGGVFPEFVQPGTAGDPPVDVSGWRRLTDRPAIIVDAWAAADPSLRTKGPSAIVSIVRVAGDTPQAAAINTSLAAELEGAIDLAPPPGDTLADSGAVASRVAIEAAVRAVVNEDAGTVTPRGRMAVLQIPVFLTNRYLSVEHFVFEDRGDPARQDAVSTVSRFTLHNLRTGGALDMDSLLGTVALDRLNALVPGADEPAEASPVAWHPSRPGIVLVFHADAGADAKRVVVPWREVLPLLDADSPLRDVADSIH